MSRTPAFLVKDPALAPELDFYRLRREAIGYIEQMGSQRWTDYNVHDPGITILEALCYAITDLAYRLGWRIEDILAPETPAGPGKPPYPNQPFYTARQILTVSPVTGDDFRRVLIDLAKVRNGWLVAKECACETSYFTWCELDQLRRAFAAPAVTPAAVETWARGLYEALLELETDAELGDLNGRKVEHRAVFHDAGGAHTTIYELRFPDVSLIDREGWAAFAGGADAMTVKLLQLGAAPGFNVFTDLGTAAQRDAYVRAHWRDLFYVRLEVEFTGTGMKLDLGEARLRMLGDSAARTAATADGLRALLEDAGASGMATRYRRKAAAAAAAVASAKAALRGARPLDEDYCTVRTVGVEEVAVCADVEVAAAADIEQVQAEIWFAVERYFSPPIRFRTLEEMMAEGRPTEEIFDGPALENGFIQQSDIDGSAMVRVLRVSDLLNRLMDIDGVIAVRQLLLTKYDAMGNPVPGAADPVWVNGDPVFDSKKVSASWLLFVGEGCQPRLYTNLSRFLFFKNGLPFVPRLDEAVDTLNERRGEAERPKNPNAAQDLRVPAGQFRHPEDYYPVQYSLPEAYGVGAEGLPTSASLKRKAQARQLKGYLMVFEQLLVNAYAQLAHTAELFSLDPAVRRTVFVQKMSETLIAGFTDVAGSGMTQAALEAMTETETEFLERRNRFLNHLLARFGEDFSEYALVLSGVAGRTAAQQRLVDNKLAFLGRIDEISRERGRAFDASLPACGEGNVAGVERRVRLLLGQPDLAITWTAGSPIEFQLKDRQGRVWLAGAVAAATEKDAHRTLLGRMILAEAYEAAGDQLALKAADGSELGRTPEPAAAGLREQLVAWSSLERMLVVEHVLLRPKFPGDALWPADGDCACDGCGGDDPYSFRLTFVMPGWVPEYTENLDFRRFADRTIQRETPSHLLGKTCWVGNDGYAENLCDEVVGRLADLLGGDCPCAIAIYRAFSQAFTAWYENRTAQTAHREAWRAMLTALFASEVQPTEIECAKDLPAAQWAAVSELMLDHFTDLAVNGWQFERFERVWCEWLEANRKIDWTEERLAARLTALLRARVTGAAGDEALCACAKKILTAYGTAFGAWMDAGIEAGLEPSDFPAFVAPAMAPCTGLNFAAGTAAAVGALLGERYKAYTEVSYRLRMLLGQLVKLRNTYPGATLHDCDDGSDQNPVRLDNTALGNYPLRTTLT